jgi:signal transduction histidine kinase
MNARRGADTPSRGAGVLSERDAREGRRLHTPATILAICLAEVAAVLESTVGNSHPSALALVVFGALLILCSVAALYALDRGKLAMGRALVLLDVGLGVAFLFESDTDGFFALFPPVTLVFMATSIEVVVAAIAVLALTVAALARHAGCPLGVVEGHSLGFVGGATLVVAFVRIAIAEQRARADVQRMAGQMEELATTRERNRIAREIHDGVGHALAAVHVHLETARVLASTIPEAAAVAVPVERAQEGAREALQEVRRSVRMLRTSIEHGTLVDAVRALADECRRAGVEVEVSIDGVPRRLPPATEFALYRVAQEALTNVRRHALATNVRVSVIFEADAARVQVRDDGKGASSETVSGYGLVGIRERAALLGGSVEVNSVPGEGFAIDVRVPT